MDHPIGEGDEECEGEGGQALAPLDRIHVGGDLRVRPTLEFDHRIGEANENSDVFVCHDLDVGRGDGRFRLRAGRRDGHARDEKRGTTAANDASRLDTSPGDLRPLPDFVMANLRT